MNLTELYAWMEIWRQQLLAGASLIWEKSDENKQRGRQKEVGESELSICFTFEGD